MAYATSTPKTYPAQQWRMPPLSTVFLCDDCKRRTLGEMLDGIADESLPKNDEDILMVLERYGADRSSPIVTYSFMQRDEASLRSMTPTGTRMHGRDTRESQTCTGPTTILLMRQSAGSWLRTCPMPMTGQ